MHVLAEPTKGVVPVCRSRLIGPLQLASVQLIAGQSFLATRPKRKPSALKLTLRAQSDRRLVGEQHIQTCSLVAQALRQTGY